VLRGDAGRGRWLGLSSGQLFSLLLLAAVALALVGSRRGAPVGPRVAAAALALLATSRAAPAVAWPQPQPPTAASPQQPAAPPTAPTGTPSGAGPGAQPPAAPPSDAAPISPYPEPAAAPAGAPLPPPTFVSPQPQPPPPPAGRPRYELGAMLGLATPINRREGQVATLAGPSLSLGVSLSRGAGLWLDFDSLGNADASHGSLTVSGGVLRPFGERLELGGRVGLGLTLVNFDEPAFRDVTGSHVRFEGLLSYRFDDRWQLWIRPISIDVLQHSDLGGPITTWQLRVGVAARFGSRRASPGRGRPAAPPPAVANAAARRGGS
jgi:hypothetical protein